MTESELKKEIEKILYDFCYKGGAFARAIRDLISLAKSYKKGKKK